MACSSVQITLSPRAMGRFPRDSKVLRYTSTVRFRSLKEDLRSLQSRAKLEQGSKYSRYRCSRPLRAAAKRNSTSIASAKGVEESTLVVPSGIRLEVLSQSAEGGSTKPPIVFLHGSYHAAWCWAIHFMPKFAANGYDVHALSLRGQGGGDHTQRAPSVDDHVADVAFLVKQLPRPPVLVGHSFGGIFVERYISGEAPLHCPELAGAVLACAVPPYGNAPMISRFLLSKPLASIRLTLSLAARMWEGNPRLFRESFFSKRLPDTTLAQYMQLMSANSRGRLLDLKDMNAMVPLATPAKQPVMVIGAELDMCVDVQGVEDTAKAYGVKPVILKGAPHDIMLDVEWEKAADEILAWLNQL